MEPGDALIATIEASIALAGFSGITAVLGRRSQGEWRPQEDLRLVNLLANSFTAFLVSLFGVLLLSTSVPPAATWSLCSFVWWGAALYHSLWVLVRSRQLGDDSLRESSPIFYWFAIALSLSVLILQLVNIVSLREFWPFFAGIVTSLALGARQFVVLLRSGSK
jgi:hypothetical protein